MNTTLKTLLFASTLVCAQLCLVAADPLPSAPDAWLMDDDNQPGAYQYNRQPQHVGYHPAPSAPVAPAPLMRQVQQEGYVYPQLQRERAEGKREQRAPAPAQATAADKPEAIQDKPLASTEVKLALEQLSEFLKAKHAKSAAAMYSRRFAHDAQHRQAALIAIGEFAEKSKDSNFVKQMIAQLEKDKQLYALQDFAFIFVNTPHMVAVDAAVARIMQQRINTQPPAALTKAPQRDAQDQQQKKSGGFFSWLFGRN